MNPTDLIETVQLTTDHGHGVLGIGALASIVVSQVWLFLRMVRKDLNGHVKDVKVMASDVVKEATTLGKRFVETEENQTREIMEIRRIAEKLDARKNHQPQA